MYPRILICCFIALALLSCVNKKNNENRITVFCAASLTPVIEEIKQEWEKVHPAQIIINSAASGTLARQLENGAQADIFLSASPEWMEYVVHSLQPKNIPKLIAYNKLVVIAPRDNQLDSMDINELLTVLDTQKGKIAIADPGHVPLGKYTKESMEFYHLYNQLSTHFILTKDARSTLRLVELGEATFGFVYLSDAISSDKVRIVAAVPEKSHQEIRYEGIILNDKPTSILEFYDYLSAPTNSGMWIRNGFMR